MMSQRDADALGVREGTRVLVRSSAGEMRALAAIVRIRPGNVAMYYPEANVLVPRTLDPRSFTPAFKSVAVRIERA
jgi:anaerobic selenocysteine-containing dehydrogenase